MPLGMSGKLSNPTTEFFQGGSGWDMIVNLITGYRASYKVKNVGPTEVDEGGILSKAIFDTCSRHQQPGGIYT